MMAAMRQHGAEAGRASQVYSLLEPTLSIHLFESFDMDTFQVGTRHMHTARMPAVGRHARSL